MTPRKVTTARRQAMHQALVEQGRKLRLVREAAEHAETADDWRAVLVHAGRAEQHAGELVALALATVQTVAFDEQAHGAH